MKRGDIFLIGIVVVIALAFMVPRWLNNDASETNHEGSRVAKITVDGKLFKTVALTEEEQLIEVNTEFGSNTLRIHDHGIEMHEADCKDKVCFTFGFVERNGGTIICLPHRLMVEIEGAPVEGDDIDVIVK